MHRDMGRERRTEAEGNGDDGTEESEENDTPRGHEHSTVASSILQ